MTTTARARASQIPAIGSFLTSLATTTETCGALIAVKGPAGKIIPAAIRTQMRTLTRLNEYWAANKAAYNALLEASQATNGGTKAQRAGA